jgi:hypothetical protein
MPDDHSEVVPLLPIPNRTVKRFCANDSADSRVKVGHRQAITAQKRPLKRGGVFIRPLLRALIKTLSSFDNGIKAVS